MAMQPAKLKKSKSDARILRQIRAYALLCWFAYGGVILCTILELLLGHTVLAMFILATGLFVFWMRGAMLFILPSAKRLMALDEHPELFEVERLSRLYLKSLSSLPLKKEPARSVLLSHLGVAKMMQGDYEGAEQCSHDAVTRFPLRRYPNEVLRLYGLSVAIARQERYEEALPIALQCLEICESQKPNSRHLLAYVYTLLGSIEMRRGDLDEAQRYLDEGKRWLDSKIKLPHWLPTIGWDRMKFGYRSILSLVSIKKGLISESRDLVGDMISSHDENPAILTPPNIIVLCELAEELRAKGEPHLAEDIMRIVYALGVKIPNHPDAALILATYEKLLLESGRNSDVPDLKRWILPVSKNDEL